MKGAGMLKVVVTDEKGKIILEEKANSLVMGYVNKENMDSRSVIYGMVGECKLLVLELTKNLVEAMMEDNNVAGHA
jgi:hypothetical protein